MENGKGRKSEKKKKQQQPRRENKVQRSSRSGIGIVKKWKTVRLLRRRKRRQRNENRAVVGNRGDWRGDAHSISVRRLATEVSTVTDQSMISVRRRQLQRQGQRQW
ncbi:hypothetical protein ACLOJK_041400, partial [Asimina triloba]